MARSPYSPRVEIRNALRLPCCPPAAGEIRPVYLGLHSHLSTGPPPRQSRLPVRRQLPLNRPAKPGTAPSAGLPFAAPLLQPLPQHRLIPLIRRLVKPSPDQIVRQVLLHHVMAGVVVGVKIPFPMSEPLGPRVRRIAQVDRHRFPPLGADGL